MSLALLTLSGRLGKAPEQKFSPDGNEFCYFPVAVSNNKSKQTAWYNVTCNNGLVKIAMDYLHKGDKVLIIGKLSPREYKNSNGATSISLDVFATTIDLVGSKSDGESNNSNKSSSSSSEDAESFDTDELERELAGVGSSHSNNNSKPKSKSK